MVQALPNIDSMLFPSNVQQQQILTSQIGQSSSRQQQQPQQQQHLVVTDSKFDIKKEVLEEEHLLAKEVENATDDNEISKVSTKIGRQSKRKAKPALEEEKSTPVDDNNDEDTNKSKSSNNFEQFWMLVRPKVLSNLSVWDFLLDKTRFNSNITTSTTQSDVAKLDFLLREVDQLLEEVTTFVQTCCDVANADDDDGDDADDTVLVPGDLLPGVNFKSVIFMENFRTSLTDL